MMIWVMRTSRSLSVTASFALIDVVADEPLAFDQRCLVQFYLVTQRP